MLTARVLRGTSLKSLFSRYTASSIVALAVSELTLVACYGTGLVGAGAAAVIAFFAGAVPNYLLNRSWVWRRTRRVGLAREFAPYVLISLAALLLALLGVSVAARVAPGGHAVRTAFVAIAYLVVNGVLFVAKFLAYHLLLFGSTDRGAMRQSTLEEGVPGLRELSETHPH